MNLVTTQQPHLDEDVLSTMRMAKFNPDEGMSVSPAIKAKCSAALSQMNAYLAPPEDRWILGRVATMLAHYWVGALPESVGAMVAEDWVKVLTRRPAWAVERAIDEWIAEKTRRPTPAEISQRAFQFASTAYRQHDQLVAVVEAKEKPRRKKSTADIQEISKLVDEMKANLSAA